MARRPAALEQPGWQVGSGPDSQAGELVACLPSFELMTPRLLTLATDCPSKKRGPMTGSLGRSYWQPTFAGAANLGPLWREFKSDIRRSSPEFVLALEDLEQTVAGAAWEVILVEDG